MAYLSVEEIANSIRLSLRGAAAKYDQLLAVANELSGYLLYQRDVDTPDSGEVFESALDNAVYELLHHYNDECSALTRIEIHHVDRRFMQLYEESADYLALSLAEQDALDLENTSLTEYCEIFLQRYDFIGLSVHLMNLGENLHVRVQQEAADTLAVMLGIQGSVNGLRRPVSHANTFEFYVDITCIHVQCLGPYKSEFDIYAGCVEEIDPYTDTGDLATSLHDLNSKLSHHRCAELLPRNTEVCLNGCASVVLMENCVKIIVPSFVAENLIDFCKENGKIPLWQELRAA